MCFLYFFFQAEDGIRDGHVTGVQTCALPIFSEERLRAAVEAAHAGVWDRNLETGTGVWLGSIFDDLPALRNQPDLILNAVHPEDRPLLEQRLKKAAEGKEPFEADFRIYTKTGEIRYLRSRGRTLTNDQGKAVRMIGSIMDITDLYLAQAEISERSEEHTSELQSRGYLVCRLLLEKQITQIMKSI